jgi:hypothetical protein
MGAWAKVLENLKLEPIFGDQPWSRDITCRDIHPGGGIRFGSRCCCMRCHRSGKDHHPVLAITTKDRLELERFEADDEYAAEATPTVYHAEPKPKKETRRERRARLYGPRTAEPGETKPEGRP